MPVWYEFQNDTGALTEIIDADQVNANFNFLEGTVAPMSTGTYVDDVYNIGTSTARWSSGFIKNVNLAVIAAGGTTTVTITDRIVTASIGANYVNALSMTTGHLQVSGGMTITGAFVASGAATFYGVTDFLGAPITFHTITAFDGPATFNTTTTINGPATFNSTSTFNGFSAFNSSTAFNGTMTVNTSAVFQGGYTRIGTSPWDRLMVGGAGSDTYNIHKVGGSWFNFDLNSVNSAGTDYTQDVTKYQLREQKLYTAAAGSREWMYSPPTTTPAWVTTMKLDTAGTLTANFLKISGTSNFIGAVSMTSALITNSLTANGSIYFPATTSVNRIVGAGTTTVRFDNNVDIFNSTGSSILQIVSSVLSAFLYLNRATTTGYASSIYRSGGSIKWYSGMKPVNADDYVIMNSSLDTIFAISPTGTITAGDTAGSGIVVPGYIQNDGQSRLYTYINANTIMDFDTTTVIPFTTTVFDVLNEYTTTGFYFKPVRTGVYNLVAKMRFNADTITAAGPHQLSIMRGANTLATDTLGIPVSGNRTLLMVTAIATVTSADSITVLFDSGTETITALAFDTYFQAFRIG